MKKYLWSNFLSASVTQLSHAGELSFDLRGSILLCVLLKFLWEACFKFRKKVAESHLASSADKLNSMGLMFLGSCSL